MKKIPIKISTTGLAQMMGITRGRLHQFIKGSKNEKPRKGFEPSMIDQNGHYFFSLKKAHQIVKSYLDQKNSSNKPAKSRPLSFVKKTKKELATP